MLGFWLLSCGSSPDEARDLDSGAAGTAGTGTAGSGTDAAAAGAGGVSNGGTSGSGGVATGGGAGTPSGDVIAVTLTDDQDPVVLSSSTDFSYTGVVTNVSGQTVTQAFFDMQLSNELQILSATLPTCAIFKATNTVHCATYDWAIGESVTLEVKVRANAAGNESGTFSASVAVPETVVANNSATEATAIVD